MRAKHAVPVAALCALFAAGCGDGNSPTQPEVQAITVSHFLPSHNDLRAALQDVVAEQNGGLGFRDVGDDPRPRWEGGRRGVQRREPR